jgi:hypothetical protein
VLYAVTGLAGQEARRQLASIDLSAGGQWGAPSKKETPLSYLLLVDQMLGGMYLRSVQRKLDSELNKYGVRDRPTASFGNIETNKLKNFGLTYPLPLDLMFAGKRPARLISNNGKKDRAARMDALVAVRPFSLTGVRPAYRGPVTVKRFRRPREDQ